jgi:hypothetical protein
VKAYQNFQPGKFALAKDVGLISWCGDDLQILVIIGEDGREESAPSSGRHRIAEIAPRPQP